MSKQIRKFMAFVGEQGVVGLAVGLAIGTQVGQTVKAIVDGFINPLVGLIVGNQDGLQAAHFSLTLGHRTANFLWGSVVSSVIVLCAVSAVIYYVVMGLKLNKLDKAKK